MPPHRAVRCASSPIVRTLPSSQGALTSNGAEVDTKPELEIYVDDVICSHGATTGQIDKQALFYMRSRGISLAQAKMLLIEAFLNEAIDKIKDEFGSGMCNITRCCTDVCPEHIQITDNSIIPLKERVVDRFYDPVMWIFRKLFSPKPLN